MQHSRFPAFVVILLLLSLLMAGCTPGDLPNTTILYHRTIIDGQTRKQELWTAPLGGGKPSRLGQSDQLWYAVYSPDYTRIACSEFYAAGIWVMNADGSGAVRLNSDGFGPDWSPDGKMLAYDVESRVWVMNADGTGAKQVSSIPGSHPDWSPDGTLILFHGEVNNGIWQVAPDGSGERLLYRDGGYPAWSPDGEQIAYISLMDWNLWIMNKDGTGKRKLTEHGALLPEWSPDGQWIAYELSEKTTDDKSQTNIWIIKVDSTASRRVIEDGRHPVWYK